MTSSVEFRVVSKGWPPSHFGTLQDARLYVKTRGWGEIQFREPGGQWSPFPDPPPRP